MFVKICGCCSAGDVKAVAALGPDALGFIFWKPSKRAVDPEEVAGWTAGLPSSILKVGVFVDAGQAEILKTVADAGLDVVQLHSRDAGGGQYPDHVKLWRVFYPDDSTEFPFNPNEVDACILDSYSTEMPGGTGVCCDWEKAAGVVNNSPVPILLAGGLTPENVVEAITKVKPWGVDVSSGVELRPRVKNLIKVKEFIKHAKSAG